jgi:hypothetical protein
MLPGGGSMAAAFQSVGTTSLIIAIGRRNLIVAMGEQITGDKHFLPFSTE